MKNKLILIIFLGMFLMGVVSAGNYAFENTSGTELMKIYGSNGNVSILGDLNVGGDIYGAVYGVWNGSSDYYLKSNPYGFYNSTSLTSLSQLINDLGIGNWTLDKSSYSTTVQANALYYGIGNPYGFYNSSNFVIGDYYLKSNPYGYLNSTSLSGAETDPLWTSNQSSYYNKTQIETNFTSYYNSSQTEGAISSANTSMKNYVDGKFIPLVDEGNLDVNSSIYWAGLNSVSGILGSQITNDLNWVNASSISGSYYLITNPFGFFNSTTLQNLSQLVDNLGNRGYTSLSNFTNDMGFVNSSQLSGLESDPLWTANYSAHNSSWSSTYNVTYNTWAYNQTLPAITYADLTFLRKDGDNGTGEYNFNGGWTNGGMSIRNGDLYAQSIFVYNISSLQVSNLNINGSIVPHTGFDNQFNIGSSALRWNDGYYGGNLYVNGTVYGNIYGVWNGSTNYYTISQIENNFTSYYTSTQTNNAIGSANTSMKNYVDGNYYLKSNPYGYINSTSLAASESDPLWTGNYSTYLTLFNWNKTYADTLYAPINYGDNWNKTYADTLYYGINNPYGYYNSTTLPPTSSGNINGSGTSGYIARFNATGSINNSVIYENGGKIGIGTTNPVQKLDVVGFMNASRYYLNANPNTYLTDDGTTGVTLAGGYLYLAGTGTSMYVENGAVLRGSVVMRGEITDDTGILDFNDDVNMGNGDFYLNNSLGNVGIGTTSPSYKLDVAGAVNASAYFINGTQLTASSLGGLNGSGSSNYIAMWNSSGSLNSSAIYQTGKDIGIHTNNPNSIGASVSTLDIRSLTTGSGAGSGIRLGQSDSSRVVLYTYGEDFYTSVPNGNYYLQTNGSTRFFINGTGSVGIGTTSPTAKLNVNGTTNINGFLTIYGNSLVNDAARIFLQTTAAGEDASIYFKDESVNAGAIRYINSDDSLRIYGKGTETEMMRMDASGNVGINTTSPSAKLHVKGDMIIEL